MSNYGNQPGSYGQYDPYNQPSNPYQQQQGYGAPQGGRYGDAEQGNAGYEMSSTSNTNNILNKCTEINQGIQELSTKRTGRLAQAQHELLDSSTGKEDQAARQNLDYVEDDINNTFRYLRDLLKKIKQTPGSGSYQAQIDLAGRNLRKEIEAYQKAQSDFDKRLREQVRRRYEIANPDATPDQVDQGVQNVLLGQEQTFQSTGLRTRQANDARQAALERSTAIRKIEQDMIELGRLYQEVADLVQQQEPAVEQINQGAQDVVENVDNANKQIDSAIKSARNARRWKWYALIIVILIIAIIVGVAVGVEKSK